MSNYGNFNFNNLTNLDGPDQNTWYDASINNSFSSNNGSSISSSNHSINSTSLTGNFCSNFSVPVNSHPNGNLNNLNNNSSFLTNSLANNLTNNWNNNPINHPANDLASNLGNNHFNSSYYFDYQAHNSSSNSSSIAQNSEYDYNQQNLVTNLNESNLTSNLTSNVIPTFYPTFSQGANVKDQHTNHQPNGHRIDSLISNANNLPSSNSSVCSSGSPYQLASSIDLQPANQPINSQFNHVQNNFGRATTNLSQENGFEPYRSPEQSNSPYSYPFNTIDELKYEAFPKQLLKTSLDYLDFDPEKEKRRKMNNNRERIRVQRMNEGFLKLNKTCNKVTNKDEKLTKYEVLRVASDVITSLEKQVSSKLQIAQVIQKKEG